MLLQPASEILHALITRVHKITDCCVQRCRLNSVYGFKHLNLVPPRFKMLPLIILFLNICKAAFCGGKCEAVGNLQQPEFIQECAVEAQSSQFIHTDYEVNTI